MQLLCIFFLAISQINCKVSSFTLEEIQYSKMLTVSKYM